MAWRVVLVAAAMLAAAGAAYAIDARLSTGDPEGRVLTAPVARGDIQRSVLASGIVKPSVLVAVGAQVSGRVTSVEVAVGEAVTAGALIAEIDSVPQQNALRTAEAALANVRAQRAEKRAALKQAELNLARQEKMVARAAVSQADYEAAEAEVAVIRAQIAALDARIVEAEVALETARVNLDYTKITAPVDGTVLAVVTQAGQTVNAAQSAPTIVILGQIDVMTVRAEISEADVVHVRPGQKVYFTILGDPQHRYEALLDSIEPAPESIVGDSSVSGSGASSGSSSATTSAIYYNGIFHVPNPDGRLRTYMTAEVQIVLDEAADVLTVPSAALGRRIAAGRYNIEVLGAAGEVASREIEVGLNNNVTAEVRAGLAEGERVVTGRLGDGGDTAAMARRNAGRLMRM
ncbi:MAG: efflux RND transporter periplasmic adaptor subunit [Kiloniellaceae bacterium]